MAALYVTSPMQCWTIRGHANSVQYILNPHLFHLILCEYYYVLYCILYGVSITLV